MPLAGLVDPSHYERAHDKPGRLPKWLTLDEVRLAAMTPNPKWAPWTYELIEAVLTEHQERGRRLSVTTLTSPCPRATVIERMENYIGSLDGAYASLRGTMIHRTLEAYPRQGSIAEHRFYTTIDGIEISGSPDLLTTDAIYDYKTTETPPPFGYPYRHHTEQLMFNAYIARHAEKWEDHEGVENGELPFDPRDYPVSHAVAVYLGPRGPKVIEYLRKEEIVTPTGAKRYPKRPYVWTDEEVLAEFRPRLHIMRRALDSYPEWPEPWVDPETEKVYTAESLWGGEKGWKCPGPPICNLPNCVARRDPSRYVWPREELEKDDD